MRTVALVACCKQKLERAAPARELYRSDLFRKSLAYAETIAPGRYWILSAKHGLVEPRQVLEPYELSLEHLDPEERAEWAHTVGIQLGDALEMPFAAKNWPGYRIVVLGGSRYVPQLPDRNTAERPLDGMQIGQRLQWLRAQVALRAA